MDINCDSTINSLQEQEKLTTDIQSLLSYGVDLKLIAKVKNLSEDRLINIIHSKQLKNPIMQSLDRNFSIDSFSDQLLNSNVSVDSGKCSSVFNSIEEDDNPLSQLIPQLSDQISPQLLQAQLLNHHVQQAFMFQEQAMDSGKLDGSEITRLLSKKERKQRKKAWKEHDFPTSKVANYYCLDCGRGNDIRDCECGRASWKWCEDCKKYQQPSYHECFLKKRKKIRKKWKERDFPNNIEDIEKAYYCADCRMQLKKSDCECGRKGWKWCTICQGYKQPSGHSHFQKNRTKKKRRWKKSEFPISNHGKYYCMDCQSSSETRKCSCGRDGWRWCEICNSYNSKSHKHFRKRKHSIENTSNTTNKTEDNTAKDVIDTDLLVDSRGMDIRIDNINVDLNGDSIIHHNILDSDFSINEGQQSPSLFQQLESLHGGGFDYYNVVDEPSTKKRKMEDD